MSNDKITPPAPNTNAASLGVGFANLLHEYQEALDTIRELDQVIAPHAIDIDRRRATPAFIADKAKLSNNTRAQFIEFLDDVKLRVKSEAAKTRPQEAAASPVSGGDAGGTDPALGAAFEDEAKRLLDIFRDSKADMVNLAMQMQRQAVSPSRADVLRNSLLTMAVGAFEALISGIAHKYYRAHPGVLGAKKEFSLEDLTAYGSLDDAREALISGRVDDLLRENFESWLRWYDESFKLKSNTYCIDFAAATEAFQRRHLIVHNSGRVSRRYLEKTSDSPNRPALGDRLEVSRVYLTKVLDELDSLGNLLLIGAWSKILPDEEPAAMAYLHLRSYTLMCNERWLPVKRICGIAKRIKLAEMNRLINQCNEWLAIKRTAGTKAIRAEVIAWDVSALDPGFHLVRMALLDDLNGLFELLPTLRSAMVTREALNEWPVLSEARADKRYAEYVAMLDATPSGGTPVLQVGPSDENTLQVSSDATSVEETRSGGDTVDSAPEREPVDVDLLPA